MIFQLKRERSGGSDVDSRCSLGPDLTVSAWLVTVNPLKNSTSPLRNNTNPLRNSKQNSTNPLRNSITR